jgi:DNA invertase Pin-like site-specific DNA recombinase
MRVAIYARVSTESQEARGTIGSQLEVLRKRVAAEGHELVAEYPDDGWSGAQLDRPGLDALRDAAQAGQLDAVWCLSPDRLARVYAYQVIVVDELARFGVTVLFHDTPPIVDDPQAQLLTQVQGVIAEYERAKIAERYRRGKLWRTRAGEVIAWKCREWPINAADLVEAQSRPSAVTKWQSGLGSVDDRPVDPQRSLHRPGILQSHHVRSGSPSRKGEAPGRAPA